MRPKEKRRAKRVFHALKVTLIWENGESETISTIDLSATGVLLDVARAGRRGEVLDLRFEVSPGTFIHATGVARRSRPAFGGKRHTLALAFTERQDALFSAAYTRELAWSGGMTA